MELTLIKSSVSYYKQKISEIKVQTNGKNLELPSESKSIHMKMMDASRNFQICKICPE